MSAYTHKLPPGTKHHISTKRELPYPILEAGHTETQTVRVHLGPADYFYGAYELTRSRSIAADGTKEPWGTWSARRRGNRCYTYITGPGFNGHADLADALAGVERYEASHSRLGESPW